MNNIVFQAHFTEQMTTITQACHIFGILKNLITDATLIFRVLEHNLSKLLLQVLIFNSEIHSLELSLYRLEHWLSFNI